MPKFKVEHKNNLSPEIAFKKVKHLLVEGDDLKKYDPGLKCDFNDGKMSCQIKGSQFSAQLSIQSESKGSNVVIDVDLPLLLSPFKGKVQELLGKILAKNLV